MSRIELFVTGFGRHDLVADQKRLLDFYLLDEHGVCVLDNSSSYQLRVEMEQACRHNHVGYQTVPSQRHLHEDALNRAARFAVEIDAEYWAVVDHDVFPRRPVSLIETLDEVGFYGMANSTPDGSVRWLWPGLAGFSRRWLDGRVPDFTGIPGADAGAGLHVLFSEEDWGRAPLLEHGYENIRPPDEFGTQSYAVETVGPFLHLGNASNWKVVRDRWRRDQILRDLLKTL